MTTEAQTRPAEAAHVVARLVSITGVAQGVGFRPFVHRLALRHGLAGWVRNEAGGVEIALEGPPETLDRFVDEMKAEAPPLTRFEEIRVNRIAPVGLRSFEIQASQDDPYRRQPVSPDVATCPSCLAELEDPGDRRYGYPFITCTDCGPRFTIIESMPYDRERTSMRGFPQCPTCLEEYRDPAGRRYRSETNSCAVCGPRLWWTDAEGVREDGVEPGLAAAARTIVSGKILALRGLGGFHLAVDATDEAAVARLRQRKAREAKPLAVMVAGLEEARALGEVGPEEERLLASRERPVVLLHGIPGRVAPSVAPSLDTIGVMTAYTPLHRRLLEIVRRPLVMTSGNVTDEPIAISNEEARARLGGIADAFLLHDREIVARYDDSVVRVVDGAPVFLRRARGYAPLPLSLPVAAPVPLLAVGPHLKNTFTLAHGRFAYVSQHVGDLENLETLAHFEAALERFRRLFRIEPRAVARDLHPEYLSSRVADDLGLPTVVVQHHHAHVAAVAAEHGVTDRVVGLAYDGTGYGDDGRVWGAELLVADLAEYTRMAHLRYAPLPGGDRATRNPWRVALGYLSLAPEAAPAFALAFLGVPVAERRLAERQIESRVNAPWASSMGRLFDAAAAVLGLRRASLYDGQAPMELEAAAGRRPAEPLPFPIVEEDGGWVLDPLPLLAALGERALAGDSASELAARFHESVAASTAELARRACEATGLDRVALGGGVFQNARLLSSVRRRLKVAKLRVLVPRSLGPADGAISYGQAAVAAVRLTQPWRNRPCA